MPFPISKTTSATGMTKSGMTLNYVANDDGTFITWSQSYTFVDGDGVEVYGLQQFPNVSGQIPLAEMQTNYPELLNALTFIWGHLDNQIKQQEGL